MITRPRINLLLLSVVCCSLLLICACGEKRQIRQTLRKFNTTTIVFPERMKVIQNGKDSMSPVPEGLKYVIFIPPEECSTCSIGHMPESRRFHCFLISSKGNPIFTGDLRRPYMQSLLKGFFRDSRINCDL